MNIRCSLAAMIVGLALLPAHRAFADDVLYRFRVTAPLSPLLRDLVTREFSKDPDLSDYLDHDDDDDRCRDPLTKFSGATAPLNPKGDTGAFIRIVGCGWGGSAGAELQVFLREKGKWKHVGETHISGSEITVLRRTDNGLYRLDLGWERDCNDAQGRTMETDGIMTWNGKKYDRRPCKDYSDFFKSAARAKKNKEPARR